MSLDSRIQLDADHQIDDGQPRPMIFSCLNAHAVRREDLETVRPSGPRPADRKKSVKLCAVCGVLIPGGRRGQAKTCSEAHARFVIQKRNEAYLAWGKLYKPWRRDAIRPPFTFLVEAQPWYRGAATVFLPAAAVGRGIPADWWDGWQWVHGG